MKAFRIGAALAAALAVACGCDGTKPTGSAAGPVTYKGEPVTAGVVNFLSKQGGAATAKIGPDGRYKIDGPLEVGEYTAYVTPPVMEPGPPGTKPPAPAKFEVPAKYRDPATSGVTVTLKAGANDVPVKFGE